MSITPNLVAVDLANKSKDYNVTMDQICIGHYRNEHNSTLSFTTVHCKQ